MTLQDITAPGQSCVLTDEVFIKQLKRLFSMAHKTIDITTFKLEAGTCFKNAHAKRLFLTISEARARGVKIRIIVNWRSDKKGVPRTNDVSSHELQKVGCDCFYVSSGRCQHSKIILIDDELAIIGSHNLSVRSLTSNAEASVALSRPEDLQNLRKYFETLLKSCVQFSTISDTSKARSKRG